MKNKPLSIMALGSLFVLSGCSSMDNFFSDMDYSNRPEPAVTHPVPRTNITPQEISKQNTPSAATSYSPSTTTTATPASKPPSAQTSTQTVVPNVAPSLGE